jgi:fructose 1,6-bisphosphate aldolase/phosphatase
MFADPSFDRARDRANEVMDYFRAHGPFEPHRLPLDDMEYTTMPAVAARLTARWEPLGTEGTGDVTAPHRAPATAGAG